MVSSSASSRKGRSSRCSLNGAGTLCKGDELMNSHSWRMVWWLTVVLVLVAVILIALLANKMDNDATSAWHVLSVNTSISPTAQCLGALVGLMAVFAAYTSYMLGYHKGHLDNYPAQYGISVFLRLSLWVYFMYGFAYGGTIGSCFSLLLLLVLTLWNVMTGHSYSAYHSWLTLVELAFIVFLLIWMSLSRAAMFPSP